MMNADSQRNSPALRNITNKDNGETPPRSSGSAHDRQTKKLQLRNAGFRGAALPTRDPTPKSVSSNTWSSLSTIRGSSDVENVSPAGSRTNSPAIGKRQSSGVLQDIGNSTITQRPKRVRPRVTSNRTFRPDSRASDNNNGAGPSSPPQPPKSTLRQRSIKMKPRVSQRRRSVSAETSKYIEHLETELANTQSQLSSITSPSVTRAQSSRVRDLNVATKQLQEELSEWESKYEDRVQEEVDRHVTIETDLRARIRNLEQDAEDATFRIQELEVQLEATTENMQAVETANVNLEKRLEIMSELLASTKIDLHTETPGRMAKHVRPKSMLPRFPTASSLMGSPERQPRTQPTSPLAYSKTGYPFPESPVQSFSPINTSPEHSDFMSEAESVFSEDSATCDSMTSAENVESTPVFNPWSLPPTRHGALSKPVRRMRRFGAGSMGPKPLILPTTSHRGTFPPASAPPLEHSQTTPCFFPARSPVVEVEARIVSGRRRASTTANEITIANLEISPFLDIPEQSFNEDSQISFGTPPSTASDMTTRRHSLNGVIAGRNLLDELTAVRSSSSADCNHPPTIGSERDEPIDAKDGEDAISDAEDHDESRSILFEAGMSNTEPSETLLGPLSSPLPALMHHRSRSTSLSIPTKCTESMFDRLRNLFSDFWRSPIAVARYLIQTAQARMRIPRPLVNVQWWLVGVLLGPMAKRRLLATTNCHGDLEDQPLLIEQTADDYQLAYDTFDPASPGVSTPGASGTTARSRKRTLSKMRCAHRRRKHSPWLWIKFTITLAFAVGAAFKEGPGSLLRTTACRCVRREVREREASS